MRILTKEWVNKQNLIRLINCLKEYDEQKESYEEIKIKSKNAYYLETKSDKELAKIIKNGNLFDKLYEMQVQTAKNTLLNLPKEITNKINNINSIYLGYATKEDNYLLSIYAKRLLVEVEKQAQKANNITEIAEDYLPNEFILDEFVGELVYKEYSKDENYFINIGGSEICIENYEIIERENFKINKWEENNPLTLWTALNCAELHYINNDNYELYLLMVDGNKYGNQKFWYFTIKGTNIKRKKAS